MDAWACLVCGKSSDLGIESLASVFTEQSRIFIQDDVQAMEPLYENVSVTLDMMHGKMNWGDYSPEVEKVMVDGFKDPKLKEALLQLEHKTILYTGGGIIQKSYFELGGLRSIHVHPGHLPHVRGSDGVLYSSTTREKPGVSMFYMEAGLDTGDIIAASDQTLPDFQLGSIARPDDQTLYRALYSYYDPILRAECFVQTVKSLGTEDLSALPVIKQDVNEGATYRFMKDEARREALGLLFRD